jgi:delta-aminolevulinic acid dehydratase/porphobilinogen synthase
MDYGGVLKFRIAANVLNYLLEIQKERTLKQLLESIKQQGADAILTYFKENSIRWG